MRPPLPLPVPRAVRSACSLQCPVFSPLPFSSLLQLCTPCIGLTYCDTNPDADARPPCARVRASTVVVRFKAVGNAPIMKQNFYKITASNRFQAVIQFLRKELGWKQGDPLVSIPLPLLLTRPAVRARVLPARARVSRLTILNFPAGLLCV